MWRRKLIEMLARMLWPRDDMAVFFMKKNGSRLHAPAGDPADVIILDDPLNDGPEPTEALRKMMVGTEPWLPPRSLDEALERLSAGKMSPNDARRWRADWERMARRPVDALGNPSLMFGVGPVVQNVRPVHPACLCELHGAAPDPERPRGVTEMLTPLEVRSELRLSVPHETPRERGPEGLDVV